MKSRKLLPSGIQSLLLGSALLLEILLSPKWTVPLAAWLLPVVWVWLVRHMRIWPFIIYTFVIKYTAGIIGFTGVFPFPAGVLFVYFIFTSAISVVPYLADRLTRNKIPEWLHIFLLPSLFVLIEYAASFSPAGTWGSIAYSQAGVALTEHISVLTGIWGIVFLIYMAGTVTNAFLEKSISLSLRLGFLVIGMMVITYSFSRSLIAVADNEKALTIGSVTANQLTIAEALYLDHFKDSLRLPPRIGQADHRLKAVNQAFLAYLTDPGHPAYEQTRKAKKELKNRMFEKSGQLAAKGAEVIVWSEAALQIIKSSEDELISEAAAFSRRNGIWFVCPVAVLHPGVHQAGTKFMENKLLIFSPKGELMYEYLKNVPVEGLEPSFGGDGNIPVIEMNGVRVASVICYDADFPDLMVQAGNKRADLLLIPSSDWFVISEAHALMARQRAIENGMSLFRPAGNGRTLATDAYGNILLNTDYYYDPQHISLIRLPASGVPTLYSQMPTLMIITTLVILCAIVMILVVRVLRTSWRASKEGVV